MDKRRPNGNLFFIVCYLCLTSGKGSNAASTSTSSQMTTTSVDKTTTSFTTSHTTTQAAMTATVDAGGTTDIIAKTDANTKSITMSNSVIWTSDSNTSTPSTDDDGNITKITATTNATMPINVTYPSTSTTSTSDTRSMTQWILTIAIPVICGLLILMIIIIIVYHRYHRKHGDERTIKEQEMMAKSDVELVRFENEYVDNSKKDFYQLHEDDNKVLDKECSKQGDYDEVPGIPGSECESASENDEINNGINKNTDNCKVSAKSKDLLKEDKYYADVEVDEGSAKEINGTRLQISRSGGNDNHYSEVSLLGEKESFEQTENPVYTEPIKHVYSSLSPKWKVKTNSQSFEISENQATDENNHTGSSYYDYVDVNVSKNTNTDDETFDATYDHLDLDRGPQRNRSISDESILNKDEYDIISCKQDKTTVGKKDAYSKVSSRPKHDPEVDKDVSRGALERDDSNRKISEQEKIMVEVDTNIYDSIEKSIDSLMSPDSKRTAKTENKTIELQTLTGFAISPQKQDTDTRNKYKEPYPAPEKANFDNINSENMQNEDSASPNGYMKNDGLKPKGGESLKAGQKFRIKETNYEEVNPTKYQESTEPQKSIRSDYEEVETDIG